MKRKLSLLLTTAVILSALFTGCTSTQNKEEDKDTIKKEETLALKGKGLSVYCGAGMTKPFEKIAEEFKKETGCDIKVTYANAAQIQTQINTSEEGDLFIAGSSEELKPVKDQVKESTDLVKHIPVLAVKNGNPKEITGLNDLTKDGVEVVLGDYEATPIGKIAKKALGDAKIFKKVNVVANTSTAPELTNAITSGECDATIVWKENVKGKDIEIVNTKDLDKYIKTVPAASLKCSENKESLTDFIKFLNDDKAKDIWKSFGYEVLN